jgi:hypothetical protein
MTFCSALSPANRKNCGAGETFRDEVVMIPENSKIVVYTNKQL